MNYHKGRNKQFKVRGIVIRKYVKYMFFRDYTKFTNFNETICVYLQNGDLFDDSSRIETII